MKLKLIAIALIALFLVLTVAPMAVTAKPIPSTTFTEKVYGLSEPDTEWVLGHSIGKVTVYKDTGAWSLTADKVTPGITGFGVTQSPTDLSYYVIGTVTADENGRVSQTGTLTTEQLARVQENLANGGVFIVWIK